MQRERAYNMNITGTNAKRVKKIDGFLDNSDARQSVKKKHILEFVD
jgi:hypothetical protein